MRRTLSRETPKMQVTIEGLSPKLADYARRKIGARLEHAPEPVLYTRIRLTRHRNPAMERPIVAQANVDLNGRLLRAQVAAPTGTEAIDTLEAKLRGQLKRSTKHWQSVQARRYHADPQEWRRGDPPAERQPWFPRPPAEREIVRRKSFTPPRCTVDEAAEQMDELDYAFHLFTERGSGQDSVLYRAGPTGYRLAQLTPQPDQITPGQVPVTISKQPAPSLDTDEAIERLNLSGLPFVFYLDTERGRGQLLYRRYDGHYGLITPAS